jgi:hypothetical protein
VAVLAPNISAVLMMVGIAAKMGNALRSLNGQ